MILSLLLMPWGGAGVEPLIKAMELGLRSHHPLSSPYGISVVKRVINYGNLDPSPISITRSVGRSWLLEGLMYLDYFNKLSAEEKQTMQQLIVDQITTTFGHHHDLQALLDPHLLFATAQYPTNQKALVCPNGLHVDDV